MRSLNELEALIDDAEERRAVIDRELEELKDELSELRFDYRGDRLNGEEILERRDERKYRIHAAERLLGEIDSMSFPVSDEQFSINRENVQILACAASFDEVGQAFIDRWTREMTRMATEESGGIGNKTIDRISPADVRGILERAIGIWQNDIDNIERMASQVPGATPSL